MNVNQIKKQFPVETKIKLISMYGEPQMRCGLLGVVKSIDDIGQIHVSWENGSSLALNCEKDEFVIIDDLSKA